MREHISKIRLIIWGSFIFVIFINNPLLFASGIWSKMNFPGGSIRSMVSFSSHPEIMLCSLNHHGLFKSIDRAQSWQQIRKDEIYDISISPEDIVYYASDNGIFVSYDLGDSWTNVLQKPTWQVYTYKNGIVVTDTISRSSYRRKMAPWLISYNNGESWESWQGTESTYKSCFEQRGSILFHQNGDVFRTEGDEIYRCSRDDWTKWTYLGKTNEEYYPSALLFFSISETDSTIYGYAKYYDFHPGGFYLGGIFKSDDYGLTWNRISTANSVISMNKIDDLIFIGEENGILSVYDTTNRVTKELHHFGGEINSINLSNYQNREIIISTKGGLFKSYDGGKQWQKSDLGINHVEVNSIQIVTIDTKTERILASTKNSGMWYSDDGGENWNLSDPDVTTVPGLLKVSSTDPTIIYAGGASIYFSLDLGLSWIRCEDFPASYYGWYARTLDIDIDPRSSNKVIVHYFDHSLDDYRGILFVTGQYDGRVWHWQSMNWFDEQHNYSVKSQFDPTAHLLWLSRYIWYGNINPAIIGVDPDNYSIVQNITLPDSSSADLWLINGSDCFIFNQQSGILWKSSDLGKQWSYTDLDLNAYQPYDVWGIDGEFPLGEMTISPDKNKLFLLYPGNGVLVSNDRGSSWDKFNKGLESESIYQIVFSSLDPSQAYLATSDGIFSRKILTHVESGHSIAKKLNLLQNYPNPFNPETVIEYDLPRTSTVELSVFNLEGKRVRTLVKNAQTAGAHSVTWNGKDDRGCSVASGIYLYQFKAGNHIIVKKMMLLR